jgi:hypothetical protein
MPITSKYTCFEFVKGIIKVFPDHGSFREPLDYSKNLHGFRKIFENMQQIKNINQTLL